MNTIAKTIHAKFFKTKHMVDEKDPIFQLTVKTPYIEQDIKDFIKLTGLNVDDTTKALCNFSKAGISNLNDINKLVMMGYFNYR